MGWPSPPTSTHSRPMWTFPVSVAPCSSTTAASTSAPTACKAGRTDANSPPSASSTSPSTPCRRSPRRSALAAETISASLRQMAARPGRRRTTSAATMIARLPIRASRIGWWFSGRAANRRLLRRTTSLARSISMSVPTAVPRTRPWALRCCREFRARPRSRAASAPGGMRSATSSIGAIVRWS